VTVTQGSSRPIAFLAWTQRTERAEEIAAALGGTSRRFTGRLPNRRATAPLRYVVNSLETFAWLVRHRPGGLIVQNPPIVLPVLAWLWCHLSRTPLVLDSHPASFGRKGRRLWGLFLPLHRAVARRSALVLVTVDELAREVCGWGARAAVVHEAPPLWPTSPAAEAEAGQVLFVSVFAEDEPVAEVVAAAAAAPHIRLEVTGDARRAPTGLIAGSPPNVRYVGFLDQGAYGEAVRRAGVVMALTTEPTSVVRAGYEAVYAGRPLIVSDWPALREVFPYAIHTGHEAEHLTAALCEAVDRRVELEGLAGAARAEQLARWEGQLAALRQALGWVTPGRALGEASPSEAQPCAEAVE
jgi:glycosyltransferase involved in cell wall biosynthesis